MSEQPQPPGLPEPMNDADRAAEECIADFNADWEEDRARILRGIEALERIAAVLERAYPDPTAAEWP